MMSDRFSRIVFLVAGIYGLVVLVPGFFGEKMVAEKMPPAITHPEFYYGFFGVAVAWQVAFLIISRDPQRFRPIILAAILEKLSYCIACAVLFNLGRVPLIVALGGAGDLIPGTLFTISYFKSQTGASSLINRRSRFADPH
ncbi:MAG TPA: hypothetical protein VLA83_03550 [Candidatus Binatia bacterium]|nr:hypothetical protein [Candidatus Binatia bacterium]